MSNQDKLQTLVIAFEQWRNTRTHRSARTPKTLRQQAVKLFPHYRLSQIIQALKLNHAQLKRWTDGDGGSNKISHQDQFVTLPETNEGSNTSSLTLEWQFPDGAQCRLSGELSKAVLNSVVQTLTSHRSGKA